MIQHDEILLSEDLLKEEFVCDLSKCKGACCSEGDYGAPLKEEEVGEIQKNLEGIKKFMSDQGLEILNARGFVETDPDLELVTTTHNEKECLFAFHTDKSTLACAVEEAYNQGESDYLKPISCHLYPVRVQELAFGVALNYDKWSICSDACTLGQKLKVPVYRFVKSALVREFGETWYSDLEEIADQIFIDEGK